MPATAQVHAMLALAAATAWSAATESRLVHGVR
jgi:hypothetical protein